MLKALKKPRKEYTQTQKRKTWYYVSDRAKATNNYQLVFDRYSSQLVKGKPLDRSGIGVCGKICGLLK
jgi:hypothetical protein